MPNDTTKTGRAPLGTVSRLSVDIRHLRITFSLRFRCAIDQEFSTPGSWRDLHPVARRCFCRADLVFFPTDKDTRVLARGSACTTPFWRVEAVHTSTFGVGSRTVLRELGKTRL